MYVINYADQFRKNIQRHGVRAKIFCEPNYYNWKDRTLEKQFSKYEGAYHDIIQRLTNRSSIGLEMKHWVSQWMHMCKMRSKFVRDLVANIFTNIERYSFGYKYGGEEMKKYSKEFIDKGQLGGKIFQLQNFQTEEYRKRLEELTKNFLFKEWIVYISDKKNFITSDNPGFSYTHSKKNSLLKIPPVYGDYNINIQHSVVHYYPLTLKMCLCLRPYIWNNESTEEQIERDMIKEIQFENISEKSLESINYCTRFGAHKMVIGNLKEDLECYVGNIKSY